jgi:hypothetical protein
VTKLRPPIDLGEITIKDNGVGLPPGLKLDESPSLGLHLVNLLVEQLEGTLEVAADEGALFKVKFPLSGTISGLGENGSSVYSRGRTPHC